MRDYSRVSGKFWTSRTGKEIKKQGSEAIVMALYLMTSPMSNMLGLYYLAIPTAAHETGLGLDGARKGLHCCISAKFCDYCEESEMVWVFEMARYQIGGSLKATDLQVKGVQKQYDELTENPFLSPFFDRYAEDFRMVTRRGLAPEAPSMKPDPSADHPASKDAGEVKAQEPSEKAPARRMTKKPGTDVKVSPGADTPSGRVWAAYCDAYVKAYGNEPTRNARVNSQIALFVSRVPADEAPEIARFFVGMQVQYYVRKCHTVDCLLQDAESIRVQWQAGRVVTHAQASQADKSHATSSVFDRMINEAEGREVRSPMDDMNDDDSGVIDVEAREVHS